MWFPLRGEEIYEHQQFPQGRKKKIAGIQLHSSCWVTAAKVKVFGGGSGHILKQMVKPVWKMNIFASSIKGYYEVGVLVNYMLHSNARYHGVRVAVYAMYPELRSRCPGWPGICWCCHLPSAWCLWREWRPRARCLPGPPDGSYSASHAAVPPQARSVAHGKHSRVTRR